MYEETSQIVYRALQRHQQRDGFLTQRRGGAEFTQRRKLCADSVGDPVSSLLFHRISNKGLAHNQILTFSPCPRPYGLLSSSFRASPKGLLQSAVCAFIGSGVL
jgi:hypothetical protein